MPASKPAIVCLLHNHQRTLSEMQKTDDDGRKPVFKRVSRQVERHSSFEFRRRSTPALITAALKLNFFGGFGFRGMADSAWAAALNNGDVVEVFVYGEGQQGTWQRGVVERMEKSRGKAKIAYDQKDGSQGAEWISYDAGRLRELNKGGGGASADNKRKSEGGGSAAGGGSAKKGKLVLPSCPKVPKKAGAGGESAKSAESPVPAAASKQAATPSGGGDVEMGGMEEEAGKGESQGTDLQKGCSVRVLYDDEGWFGGTIKAKSSENHYVVLFPDGSAEEVEYPDPDGSVEVCYTKDVLSKKLKEFAKGPLRAAIDYACRKNKLIDAAKETAHQAADQAFSAFAKSIKAGAESDFTSLEGAAGRVLRYLKETMLGDSFDDGTWETLEERLKRTLVRVGKMMDEGLEDDDSVFDKVAGKEVEDAGASSGKKKKKKAAAGGDVEGSAEKKKKKVDGDKVSAAFIERLKTKGGNCEALFEGQWYQARIAKYEQRGDKFLVHFIGGGADQDIWVGLSENRIRPKSENWDVVTNGEVGEEVEVRKETDTKKGSKWIAATILEVRDGRVKVLLTGSGETEWMAMTRDCMRKPHIKEGGSATKKPKPPKPIDPEKERERLEKQREKEERERLKEEREREKAKEREERERIKEEERQRKEAEKQEKERVKEAEREKKAAKEREKEAEKQREREKQLAKEREKERQRELDREKERLKGVTEGVGLLERYEWLKDVFGESATIKELEVRRWLQSARDYRWMLGQIIERDDDELRVKVSWVTPSPGLEDEWIAVQHKGKIGTLNVRKKGEGESKKPTVEPAQIPDKDKELLGLVLPSEGAGVKSSGPIVFERDKGVPRASFTLVYTRELASLQRCYQVGKDSWAREDLERLKSEIEESHLRFHRSSVGQYVGGIFRPNGVVCMSCGARSPGRGVTEVWKKNFCLCDRCGTQAAKGKYCRVCERVLTELDWSLIRCDKTGAWVHAACDALDDLALSTAAAAGTRGYVCPGERDPGESAVCVGDDMSTPIAPLGSPLKADVESLFGVRVTRVGEVLYGVKYSGKVGLEWRREVSGIQGLDDKIASFIALISPAGLVIHPSMQDGKDKAAKWGALVRKSGGPGAPLDLDGYGMVDPDSFYLDRVIGIRAVVPDEQSVQGHVIASKPHISVEGTRRNVAVWCTLTPHNRPLQALTGALLFEALGAISIHLPHDAREDMLRDVGLWESFCDGQEQMMAVDGAADPDAMQA